jgi:hypothetical protein
VILEGVCVATELLVPRWKVSAPLALTLLPLRIILRVDLGAGGELCPVHEYVLGLDSCLVKDLQRVVRGMEGEETEVEQGNRTHLLLDEESLIVGG